MLEPGTSKEQEPDFWHPAKRASHHRKWGRRPRKFITLPFSPFPHIPSYLGRSSSSSSSSIPFPHLHGGRLSKEEGEKDVVIVVARR